MLNHAPKVRSIAFFSTTHKITAKSFAIPFVHAKRLIATHLDMVKILLLTSITHKNKKLLC